MLLERLIDEIARGKFKPDSTRSGRVIDSPDDEPGPQNSNVKVELVCSSEEEQCGDLHESDTSDSTSDSGSSSGDIPENHALNKVFAPPKPPEDYQCWQHSKLKTINSLDRAWLCQCLCLWPTCGQFSQKDHPRSKV